MLLMLPVYSIIYFFSAVTPHWYSFDLYFCTMNVTSLVLGESIVQQGCKEADIKEHVSGSPAFTGGTQRIQGRSLFSLWPSSGGLAGSLCLELLPLAFRCGSLLLGGWTGRPLLAAV
jgi:hypothetical protein